MPRRSDPNHDVCQSCHHKRWLHFKDGTACGDEGKGLTPRPGVPPGPCTCRAFVERPARKRK